ncbi:hypothetical protein GA0004736_0179 [Curtobacterium sp. 9128]|uniref:hypothetical protein n=1 Tax=Curtobacterium sp. 9128 TaxID=1793722 RepID=UPI0007D71331|nr:hypothetical protein [Curtobacterium sp. 9128]SBN61292.1 hypothetical protein GA0004736_0179 [Curtobacterium sp. 9128]
MDWLWQTLVTFLITIAGVAAGALWQARSDQRVERRQRSRYLSDVSTSGSWKSVIYDIRDWATELRTIEARGLPLQAASIRRPGSETLRYLVSSREAPRYVTPDLLNLLDYTLLLNGLVVRYLALTDGQRDDASFLVRNLVAVASTVSDIANTIVTSRDPGIQRELGRRS